MLTKEQNERFTRVGPGTPMGDLLRRYWMPFATVKQMHEHPTRAVTLLGEHLVAYRDRSGSYGLIQEFCPHRNTNLLWGILEPEGLRCPYHGWLFDAHGNCLEQPAESAGLDFQRPDQDQAIRSRSWAGCFSPGWAEPRPLVPRWESCVKDGIRDIGWAVLPCNWLQIMENSLDPVHVEHLHSYFTTTSWNGSDDRRGHHNYWRTRAKVEKHVKIGFDVFEHGIVKRACLEGDDESHPNWRIGHVVFPFMLQFGQIRMPWTTRTRSTGGTASTRSAR